jgi:hypothetical protein
VSAEPTKACTGCNQAKLRSEFQKDARSPDGLQCRCRTCRSEAFTKAYHTNPEKARARSRAYRQANHDEEAERHGRYRDADPQRFKEVSDRAARRSRQRGAERLNALKQPCVLCGEDFLGAIDFHHLDPTTKAGTVSLMGRARAGALEAEVAKCICLCASCHRRFHAGHPEVVKRIEAYRRASSP